MMIIFKSFQEVNPREFKGSVNSNKAGTWLKGIQKIYTFLKLGVEQKTEYASYYPKGEVNYWWKSNRSLKRTQIVTWEKSCCGV